MGSLSDMLKLVFSSAWAAIISVLFVVVITIWADLAPALKDWLKSVTGHHWVTKSLGVVLVYLVALFLFYVFGKEGNTRRALNLLIFVTVLGFAALLGFYILHYTGAV